MAMSSRMQRRRMKEPGWIATTSPFPVLQTSKDGDACIEFTCFVPTNKGSKYGNAVFRVDVALVPDFPRKSPSMCFTPAMYHSNVEPNNGSICWDATGPGWVASQVLHHIIEFDLPFLLDNPNHQDPHNVTAAQLGEDEPDQYDQKCKASAARMAVRVLPVGASREDLLKPLTEDELARAMRDSPEYVVVAPVDLPGAHKRARDQKKQATAAPAAAAPAAAGGGAASAGGSATGNA